MMESVIQYFDQMPAGHRSVVLVGGLMLFSIIESVFPLFQRNYNWKQHALINVFFTLTTVLVNLPLAFLLLYTSDYVVVHKIGILQWSGVEGWIFLILGLLILDFISSWLIHYIEHHVKWMWRFHAVHHSDQNIDTTSGNRHHPGESILRFLFTILAVAIVGAPMWMVFLYQTLSVVMTQFNHSNIELPQLLDRILSMVIVTPNMHHVHHHYRMPYSDMNYGNIFSFWDRLLGTFIEVDNRKLKYGLDTHMEFKEHRTVLGMLRAPFQTYRKPIDYDSEEIL